MILVVDNHYDTRLMLEMYVKQLGHYCHLAEDAGAAISKAAMVRFDVILTDLHIPSYDGFELVQILRSNALLPALVISMSASILEHVIERSIVAGCHMHLRKPFPIQELAVALLPAVA